MGAGGLEVELLHSSLWPRAAEYDGSNLGVSSLPYLPSPPGGTTAAAFTPTPTPPPLPDPGRTYRWVTAFSRLQKKGWGRGRRSRPAAAAAWERTYLALMPWMKTASRAQHSRLASPSSLVTTASDVT